MRSASVWVAATVLVLGNGPRPAVAQTAYGLISVVVVDEITQQPVPGAEVGYRCADNGQTAREKSDEHGRFTFTLLSPGIYSLWVKADSYQDRTIEILELPVAGRFDVRFELWKITDPWHTGAYRSVSMPRSHAFNSYYGPDIDLTRSDTFEPADVNTGLLEVAISNVIDGDLIAHLPLEGRDVYAALVLEPGVASSLATARGLGVSVNGQRPTSSNFLLDGVENNNYLITGPLALLAPEEIAQYRLSTNNFSAEYGRAAGVVANVVTRSGTNEWHALSFLTWQNEVLNSNDSMRNFAGIGRPPLKEAQPGLVLTGPLWRDRIFLAVSGDALRYRSVQSTQNYQLPSSDYLARLALAPQSRAYQLMQDSGLPLFSGNGADTVSVNLSAPAELNRRIFTPRLDYVSKDNAHRLFLRVANGREDRPDLFWTPYKSYAMPLVQAESSIAAGHAWTIRPVLLNEARVGYGSDDLRLERNLSQPLIQSNDQTLLPGSPSSYGFRRDGHHWEFLDNLTWIHGAHIFKAGGGLLSRTISGYLSFGTDGYFQFRDLDRFAQFKPNNFQAAVDRAGALQGAFTAANTNRQYDYLQADVFAEDTVRITPDFTISAGIRVDLFGSPRNTGSERDATIVPGPGGDLSGQISTAHWQPGNQSPSAIYPASTTVAARIGVAYAFRNPSRTTIRGGYGEFYDRPFDNLWLPLQNNNLAFVSLQLNGIVDASTLGIGGLNENSNVQLSTQHPSMMLLASHLKAPLAHSGFVSLHQPLNDHFSADFTVSGSLGRRLFSSDIVNREFSRLDVNDPAVFASLGRSNANLPDVTYRGNEAWSNYHAFTASLRYRNGGKYFQAAYTWSQSLDNQSDAVAGDFDFGFTGLAPQPITAPATFSVQYNPQADRGRSDFDQRQNLVFYAVWEIPSPSSVKMRALLGHWSVAAVAAVRSGLPYSVYSDNSPLPPFPLAAGQTWLPILNTRATLVSGIPTTFSLRRDAPDGGKQLLNAAAFVAPPEGAQGATGRNAFIGTGAMSSDVSLQRTFALSKSRENWRLTIRGDAYNIWNHANLGQPDNMLSDPTFGVALYGRTESTSGFPGSIPLAETARQIQLLLRVQF